MLTSCEDILGEWDRPTPVTPSGGGSSGASVEYVAYTVSGSTATPSTKTATAYTEVTNSTTTWAAGTYVVSSDVTIDGSVTLTGNVNLILCDGASLTISEGIPDVTYDLKIYGQSGGTGTITTSSSLGHSIGVTNLEVHGGTLTASSSGDSGLEATNDFLLFNGTVNSTSTAGAGIMTTAFKFYGGYVEAVGNSGSNGISYYGWPAADYIFNYSGATITYKTDDGTDTWGTTATITDGNGTQIAAQGVKFPVV